MQKLYDIIFQIKLKKECLIKEQLNKLFLRAWKKVQKELKLKLVEDLTERKLLEKKLLKNETFQHKQLGLI
jgi:hypothetical protein